MYLSIYLSVPCVAYLVNAIQLPRTSDCLEQRTDDQISYMTILRKTCKNLNMTKDSCVRCGSHRVFDGDVIQNVIRQAIYIQITTLHNCC